MATKDDEDQVNEDKANSSDENFGLPDLELKPLEEQAPKPEEPVAQEQPIEETATPTESFDAYAVDEGKSKAPMILTIVIVLVVAIAGYLIYNFVYVPSAQEKAKKEELARQQAAARKKAEEERLANERAAEEERKRQEALAKATPAVGTIEILSARTKRYYVVITSDIDDDLLMDYAKKLSAQGINLKVIPPFGAKKFHRLAIADHDTFAQAQANADAAKATYGSGVWVLKY
jgi:cytoskeletal protein RodZ